MLDFNAAHDLHICTSNLLCLRICTSYVLHAICCIPYMFAEIKNAAVNGLKEIIDGYKGGHEQYQRLFRTALGLTQPLPSELGRGGALGNSATSEGLPPSTVGGVVGGVVGGMTLLAVGLFILYSRAMASKHRTLLGKALPPGLSSQTTLVRERAPTYMCSACFNCCMAVACDIIGVCA